MTMFIELHALQSIPPSCINRDGNNDVKHVFWGDAERLRISSQSWKRAIRTWWRDKHDMTLAARTRFYRDLIIARATATAPDHAPDLIAASVDATLAALLKPKKDDAKKDDAKKDQPKKTALAFYSNDELDAVANYSLALIKGGKVTAPKEASILKAVQSAPITVDIAMFGRMMATAPKLNVDGAVCVAHALGVSRYVPQMDYYTAVDDVIDDEDTDDDASGAGMIGYTNFAADVVYRNAAINVDQLARSLGGGTINADSWAAALAASGKFIEGFYHAMPGGKQTSFNHKTVPEAMRIVVTDQIANLAGALRRSINPKPGDPDILDTAWERITSHGDALWRIANITPRHTIDIRANKDSGTVDDAIAATMATLREHRP